jgi:peptide/nickel transport system substrate-binding protein
MHALKLHRWRRLSTPLAWLVLLGSVTCIAPQRVPNVAVYASGTDLESGNPLVTVHSLSRQIQRYALFVTLARYDSSLTPTAYAASAWEWSSDRRTLLFRLRSDIRWHDGVPTTAGDVAFTIDAARDPATGYWRATDLAAIDTVLARDDTTIALVFRVPQPTFPLVLCELPILPAHLLALVPRK